MDYSPSISLVTMSSEPRSKGSTEADASSNKLTACEAMARMAPDMAMACRLHVDDIYIYIT